MRMSQTFTPPVTIDVDSSGRIVVIPGTVVTPPPPPPTITYSLQTPPSTILLSNASLVECQAAIANLPPSTSWQILNSDGVLVASGITAGPIVTPLPSVPPSAFPV